MIKEDDFSDKQRELYETMSDISEDCYCAVWMMGLEYAIWGALQDGDRQYGMGEMDAEQLERCRALATELDGWVIWVDDDECQNLPAIECGPCFVSVSDWLAKVTANVEVTGAARLHRAASRERSERGRPPGYATPDTSV